MANNKSMAQNYNEHFEAHRALWAEFHAAEHFATKTKVAEKISNFSRVQDPDEKFFGQVVRSELNSGEYSVPVEFSGFALKDPSDRCTFHVFFVDEDSIPINAAFNVDIDDVVSTFSEMLRIYSATVINPQLKRMGYETNVDGVVFRK